MLASLLIARQAMTIGTQDGLPKRSCGAANTAIKDALPSHRLANSSIAKKATQIGATGQLRRKLGVASTFTVHADKALTRVLVRPMISTTIVRGERTRNKLRGLARTNGAVTNFFWDARATFVLAMRANQE